MTMDSQEKATEMTLPVENLDNKEESARKQYATKKEVVERVKELAHGEDIPQKEEVDYAW